MSGGTGPTTIRECKYCGKKFQAPLKEIRRGKGVLCSRLCANRKKAADRQDLGWRSRWIEGKKQDPNYHKQRRAHHVVENEIKYGRLLRQPCEFCGAFPTEAHHDDYSKPLVVRWLCRSCHMKQDRAST